MTRREWATIVLALVFASLTNGKISFEIGGTTPSGVYKTRITGTIKDDTLEMNWDPERNGKKGVARTLKAKRVVDQP
jgi:hypothetical protein